MFTYTPLSNEQIDSYRKILKPGIANFTIISASEKTSKAGNPMIEIKMHVWDSEGTQGQLLDWLVGAPEMAWKLKSFCQSIGNESLYESGEISPLTLINKSGQLKIGLKKDNDGNDRPRVVGYVHQTNVANISGDTNDLDDDCPF